MADLSRNRWPVIFGTGGRNPSEQVAEFIGIGIYIILKEKNIDIWKKKLDWIADKGGLALLNTHSDYMNFSRRKLGDEEYPLEYYSGFLEYINENYDGQYWHVLPKEMARYWLEVPKVPKVN